MHLLNGRVGAGLRQQDHQLGAEVFEGARS
jgi:hypothetical protein